MVSEDSQHLGWFPVVHRFGNLCDFLDSGNRQMLPLLHELDDPHELLEVESFRGSEWVVLEERNDLGAEILKPVDVEPQEIFLVVIPSTVSIDLSATEEFPEVFEDTPAGLSLYDVERRSHLPLESHLGVAIDRAAEAALSIDESHDPSWVHESFLLVFRRGPCQTTHHRIVTAIHAITLVRGCDRNG